MRFTLFLEAGDQRNDAIRNRVELLLGADYEAVTFPPEMAEWYWMPFVRDEAGTAHYGFERVKEFMTAAARWEQGSAT